jgi:hypothetical protein
MRVVAGLSFPTCGSSAELRTKASHKRMGSVERIHGQWPVGDGIWRMVAEAVGAALGRQVGLRRLPPSPLLTVQVARSGQRTTQALAAQATGPDGDGRQLPLAHSPTPDEDGDTVAAHGDVAEDGDGIIEGGGA